MEIGGTTGLLTSLANAVATTGDPSAVYAQNTAEAVQAETAQALVESIPDPDASLGQNVDVTV